MLAHHGWYLVLQPVDLVHTLSRLLMRITNTDTYMHSLARRTVSTRPNTHSRTRMHSPAAITMSLHLMQNQNTRSNTCIHRPAAMTMSVHLVQAQAHTPTHAYITLHQSQWACALYKPRHTLRHMYALPRSNHSEHAPYLHHENEASIHLIHAHKRRYMHALPCKMKRAYALVVQIYTQTCIKLQQWQQV
jgi:hypothetical protein